SDARSKALWVMSTQPPAGFTKTRIAPWPQPSACNGHQPTAPTATVFPSLLIATDHPSQSCSFPSASVSLANCFHGPGEEGVPACRELWAMAFAPVNISKARINRICIDLTEPPWQRRPTKSSLQPLPSIVNVQEFAAGGNG